MLIWKKRSHMKKFFFVIWFLFFVFCISAGNPFIVENQKIYFVDNFDFTRFRYLASMEINGSHPQHIIQIKDTFTINKKNGLLAAGCAEGEAICFYDVKLLPDMSTYPPKISKISPYKGKIPFPEYCTNTQKCQINSLSWSRDGKRLLVIIENGNTSFACIGDFVGEYQCWEEKTDDDIYSRADWSPKEDLIVIDTGKQYDLLPQGKDGYRIERTGRKMIIVNPEGELQRTLIDGWSPAWSPDGEEIAFFRADDNRRNAGIAIIKSDGTDFRWVYRSPEENEEDPSYSYKPVILDINSNGGSSKVTWSNDKKFLIFDSGKNDYSGFYVYKLEISTGKLEKLNTNLTEGFHEVFIY